jgi:hypothetical protein
MTTHFHLRKLRCAAFNMIEVVLAMAVIAIGIMAVVGLIPVGTRASRDAVGFSYAADYSEWLLAYIADQARANWNSLNAFPNTGVGDALPDIRSLPDEVPSPTATNWQEVNATYFKSFWAGRNACAGLYRVFVEKNTPEGSRVDFDAIVRVWRSPVKEVTSSLTAPDIDGDCSDGAQINLEITWPASLPPEDRSRAVFVMQVAR